MSVVYPEGPDGHGKIRIGPANGRLFVCAPHCQNKQYCQGGSRCAINITDMSTELEQLKAEMKEVKMQMESMEGLIVQLMNTINKKS